MSAASCPDRLERIASSYAATYHQPLDGNQGSLAAIVGLVADAVSAARSTNPQKIAAAARTLDFSSPGDSAYPFPQSGGVKFDADQDNVGFIPPIIQLEGSTASPTQIVVSPAALAAGSVAWPTGG
jgi:hypothetical protein